MGTKPTCNLEEFKDLVKEAIKADMRGVIKYTPFLLEGPAGIGKTSSIYQTVAELTLETGEEFGMFEFDAATRTANDIWGIPFPDDQNGEKVLTWIKDKEFPRKGSPNFKKYGIFFCTELTSVTDEQLKVGLLDLLSNRRVAGYELPEHWYIVADGNGKKDGNVYSTLGFPIRNRLSIFEAKFEKSVWLDWCRRNGVHDSIIEFVSILPNNNQFITYNPELEDLSDGAHEQNYVCATPRSWQRASDKIKLYEQAKGEVSLKYLRLYLQSDIGAELGSEFFKFYKDGFGGKGTNTLVTVLETEWMGNEPSNPLPKIDNKSATALVKLIQTGQQTDEQLINIMYYLLEGSVTGAIDISYTPILAGLKGERLKDKLTNHAIKNANLPLLAPIIEEDKVNRSIENKNDTMLGWD